VKSRVIPKGRKKTLNTGGIKGEANPKGLKANGVTKNPVAAERKSGCHTKGSGKGKNVINQKWEREGTTG